MLTGRDRAEREHCDEELGRGVASARPLPLQINPRVLAYYDAVAEAKKPDSLGHGPAIGCRLVFGPGKKPNDLPHALKLGPCFIEPPKGPWTQEVDVPPP